MESVESGAEEQKEKENKNKVEEEEEEEERRGQKERVRWNRFFCGPVLVRLFGVVL